jgi:hypothetical protein|nr:MAG TPA: hypothetical protein [Bacteriophage sp.]
MVLVRKATEADFEWLVECSNKDWVINDYSGTFKDWLKSFGIPDEELHKCYNFDWFKRYIYPKAPQDLYIVNNGQKDVGFFCQDLDQTNSIIGGTVFLHPRSCKMSILKAIKAICIRACLIQDEFDACEVNTWTPLIVSTAQSVVPCLKESMIAEEYRILYGETRNFPSREDIIKKYNITDIDKDNCFVFDEVKRYGA